MDLVIVESPAKAKTIERYLGDGYKVLASYGHIRDLDPGEGSVDPKNDFAQKWTIDGQARSRVQELSKAAKEADRIILATDPDREGEAISWHLANVLRDQRGLAKLPMSRVVFHEVTKSAVLEAMANPRDINDELVHAYLARRLLDYLVGYTLSPVLWRKLPGARSAGRVQSVALRLICQREVEIESFVPLHYWSVEADLEFDGKRGLTAKLEHADGRKLGREDITSEETAQAYVARISSQGMRVEAVKTPPRQNNPAAPFTTSTLQQEAARKLRFSAKRTMQTAQRLYEAGHITYMRTDGTSLSKDAVADIRGMIEKEFDAKHLPNSPRMFGAKNPNAQEAHEAIRPTTINRKPGSIKLEGDQERLYSLIWKRTMACQMANAEYLDTRIDLRTLDGTLGLGATGRVMTFGGFMDLYHEGLDDQEEEQDNRLPKINEGEEAKVHEARDIAHTTKPPARFTEATLVKELERLGIGRPSTYASIISVLEDRGYVRLDQRRFFAEDTGRVLSVFLDAFFHTYVAYDFTAELERKLDRITNGELDWLEVMREFWTGFEKAVDATSELRVRDVIDVLDRELDQHLFPVTEENPEPRKCPACGTGMLGLRIAKNGGFVGCSNYPECNHTKNLGKSSDGEASDLPRELGPDELGRMISLKTGRFGPYLERVADEGEKPHRVSVPKDLSLENLSLDMALKLITMPRQVGIHEDQPIMANLGRYGPYLSHGNKNAKLAGTLEALEIGMNLAVEKLANAKEKMPATELGNHTNGKMITLKSGRFGPYVQMDKVMANIPKATDPKEVTLAMAIELIDKKMAKGGAKTTKTRAGAKKSAKK